MAELFEGEPAPDFELPSLKHGKVRLSQFKGQKNVVLFFYVQDGGERDLREAANFTEKMGEFDKRDTVVMGISYDDLESHKRFAETNGLKVDLLSDTEKTVSKTYGTFSQKGSYILDPTKVKDRFGQAFGMLRVTFLIDKEGILRKIFGHVKPDGHADESLEALDELHKT